jgi:hypothetical protein
VSLLLWLVAWSSLGVAVSGVLTQHFVWILSAAFWLLVYRRIRAAHFATENNLLAMAVGLPMFAYLLLRSKKAHANGKVLWKGRAYNVGAPKSAPAGTAAAEAIPRFEGEKLRTGN